jgi:hypothetical protein
MDNMKKEKRGGPKINPELYNSYRRPGDQPGIVQFLGEHPGFSGSRRSWYVYIGYVNCHNLITRGYMAFVLSQISGKPPSPSEIATRGAYSFSDTFIWFSCVGFPLEPTEPSVGQHLALHCFAFFSAKNARIYPLVN